MKCLNQSAAKTFHKLIEGLDIEKTSHRKIENGSWMPLSVEIIDKLDDGTLKVAICHYGEMNGDLMADPEIVFWVCRSLIFPTSFRNDYVGVNQTSAIIENNQTRFSPRMQADHTSFAKTWMKNIKEQGFLEKISHPNLNVG